MPTGLEHGCRGSLPAPREQARRGAAQWLQRVRIVLQSNMFVPRVSTVLVWFAAAGQRSSDQSRVAPTAATTDTEQ